MPKHHCEADEDTDEVTRSVEDDLLDQVLGGPVCVESLYSKTLYFVIIAAVAAVTYIILSLPCIYSSMHDFFQNTYYISLFGAVIIFGIILLTDQALRNWRTNSIKCE